VTHHTYFTVIVTACERDTPLSVAVPVTVNVPKLVGVRIFTVAALDFDASACEVAVAVTVARLGHRHWCCRQAVRINGAATGGCPRHKTTSETFGRLRENTMPTIVLLIMVTVHGNHGRRRSAR
jgi:hypothetical protein